VSQPIPGSADGNQLNGPDGGVFVLDWSDHRRVVTKSTGVHRTSGRIYKITYGEPNA
jgi:hypothetical protein